MNSREPGLFASMERLRDKIRSTFWVVPALCVLASIVLAVVLISVDHALDTKGPGTFFYPGGPEGARSLLSSVVTAMISFTGLVFSITIVVLQLTSGQFSPRVLRFFLRDRTVRFSLGIFIATFVYAMMVERSVLGITGQAPFVPRIAVSAALIFVLASVCFFIGYLARIANMVRVATIVTELGAEARRTLDQRYGPDASGAASSGTGPLSGHRDIGATAGHKVVVALEAGVVVSVNEARLVQAAAQAGCSLTLAVRIGDFVPAGAPLCLISQCPTSQGPLNQDPGKQQPGYTAGETVRHEDPLDEQILEHIALDSERTSEQDLAFSFRQLVDIAERALSPAVNDPTTACQCLDVLHDLLRHLATRHLPQGRWADAHAVLRLTIPQYQFCDFLDLAVGEIWHYGSDAAQVPHRLAVLLEDLSTTALPEYQQDLRRWAEQINPNAHVLDPVLDRAKTP